MESIVAHVRRKIPSECCVDRCEKEGCALGLAGVPPSRLLVDLDEPGDHVDVNATRCDYLFIGEQEGTVWFAPLELTKGHAEAAKFERQLQAGAKIAEGIIPATARVQLRPIAAYGGKLHRIQRDRISKLRVRFRRQKAAITLTKCGAALAAALGIR